MIKLAVAAAVLAVLCSVGSVNGQTSPSASPAAAASASTRSEVYSVTFMHAAAGKASALEDWAKKSGTDGQMAGHGLVLRHEAGAPWDYCAVQHEGPKATVDAAGNPAGASLRPLMDWHDDTYVSGPSWAEFAKAMDLDTESGKPKSKESVYVVSVYRPNVGQEDALDKFLSEPPAAGDLTAGNIVLQHLEGGAWRFLSIARYKNYQDYGTSEAKAVTDTAKGGSSWFELRNLVSFHNDTVAVSVTP